ncbi:stealth family protein [Streptomyces sp. NPDC006529]|uniref:stealth family protein n=1 Tax=Streptomyces sp. NPDC006529 TaxID=3157177 RepID=UPI0033A518BA
MTVANPEASPAVSLYRAVLPTRLRRGLARRIPAGLRAVVKRLLRGARFGLGPARSLRARRARRRWPDLFPTGGGLAAPAEGSARIALVRPTASPLGLREANLELVVAALERAGVDHFAVRGASDLRACFAVRAADRPRVAAALRECARRTPVYVGHGPLDSAVAADDAPRPPGRVALGGSRRGRRITAAAAVLRVGMIWRDPGGTLTLGLEYGCDLEFWEQEEGRLIAPRPNRVTGSVPCDAPRITVPVNRLTSFASHHTRRTRHVRTVEAYAASLPEDIRFPVDVVYTWVDGDDPEWRRRRREQGGEGYHAESANPARYLNRDELRYSLRSVEQHAPWVRRIFLVTDRQRPQWLEEGHPRITVVDHREIFDDPAALPTFNSHAIESRLHHIDGLAEHFLYFNDDMFLGRPVTPRDFFLSNGMTRAFLSPSQIPRSEVTPGDRPVNAAAKNNRRLLEELFGTTLVQKLRHAPYPLRRSVLAEIEERFAGPHRATTFSRFRSATDLSVPSSLYHYYAYLTGRAVPSDIAFAYLPLDRPQIERRLNILLARRDRQAFCINDTVSDGHDQERQARMVQDFLRAYFPVPGPFERKEFHDR